MSLSARYALAVAIVGVATMLRMFLSNLVGSQFPFATYYIGVVVALLLCGTAPAIMSCLLSYIGAEYFFYGRSAIDADPSGVFKYFAITLTIIAVGRLFLNARHRIINAFAEAKRNHNRREEEVSRRKHVENELESARFALRDYARTLEQQVANRTEQLTEKIKALESLVHNATNKPAKPIRALES